MPSFLAACAAVAAGLCAKSPCTAATPRPASRTASALPCSTASPSGSHSTQPSRESTPGWLGPGSPAFVAKTPANMPARCRASSSFCANTSDKRGQPETTTAIWGRADSAGLKDSAGLVKDGAGRARASVRGGSSQLLDMYALDPVPGVEHVYRVLGDQVVVERVVVGHQHDQVGPCDL